MKSMIKLTQNEIFLTVHVISCVGLGVGCNLDEFGLGSIQNIMTSTQA